MSLSPRGVPSAPSCAARTWDPLLLLAAIAGVVWIAGCNNGDKRSPDPSKDAGVSSKDQGQDEPVALTHLSDAERDERIEPEIKTFCAYCHPLPTADLSPREEWRHEVKEAYEFHRKSGRKEKSPNFEEVVAYFERRATPIQDLPVPPLGDPQPGALRFRRVPVQFEPGLMAPAISSLKWLPPEGVTPGRLLATEMRIDKVFSVDVSVDPPTFELLIDHVKNPCHVEPTDLDGDGARDYVVAELGNFKPTDERLGGVSWWRIDAAGAWQKFDLAWGLGRVADAQPGDFDGDGDLDLILAEFGWHKEGSISLLRNDGFAGGEPNFKQILVDPRHGSIHVPPLDLNGDGKLDFVALISQEFEAVEAFLNTGSGKFEKKPLFAAGHPSYGSSGIQMIDLDADGDQDVLYANGDGYDRGYLKPYHSVQWLENQGDMKFVHHPMTLMPGCHRALAGDMDGDHDLDIVCVALLHPNIREMYGPARFDAVCWLEQTSPGQFERRRLEATVCDHAAVELADMDGDGDLDMAVGNFHLAEGNEKIAPPSLTIWWNETNAVSKDTSNATSESKAGE